MGRRNSLVQLLPELVRTFLSPRVTVQYPVGPPIIHESYRGKVSVRPDRCIGCGLCVRDCPASALELEREEWQGFRLIYHGDRCTLCGQCEASCRQGALELVNQLPGATRHRISLKRVLVNSEGGEE